MKRREFITLLGGAAAAWPLAARAQQPAKLPTIGFLGASTPLSWTLWTSAFVQRLGEVGWIDGRTVAIEYRWAEGRRERFAEIAAEFVQLKVDVIVTVGAAALAAKQVTPTIPIVFATATDPLGGGLVASLARPEGNATGLSMQASDAAGKRSSCCAKLSPVCVAWQSSAMSSIPPLCRRSPRSARPPAPSASISTCSKSGAQRISWERTRRSRQARRRCMCVPARS